MTNSRKTKRNRCISAALALLLCLAPLLPPAAAQGDVVYISTTAQMIDLSKKCTSDAYSKGLTVVLNADIQLANSKYKPIPVFCGTFDGNGHTIKGLTVKGKGSKLGLIRTVEEGALVKDLRVEGTVAPEGTRSTLGLIAGRNDGTIERCTAVGKVTGGADVGGLCGINGQTGVLRYCSSQVELTGDTRTGGAAGLNEGLISACTNQGGVNLGSSEKATDTGGLAGRSTGVIESCRNLGAVGYKHTGYNVGGVAGIQNGSVLDSTNEGTVLGRKDVGGIVGQFEPQLNKTYGADPLEELDSQLGQLSALFTRFASQLNQTVLDATDDMIVVNDAMSAIRDAAQDGGSEGRADAQAAVDTIYQAAQAMNESNSALLQHVDDFSGTAHKELDTIRKSMADLRTALENILSRADGGVDDAWENLDWQLDGIETCVKNIDKQIDNIAADVRKIETFLEDVARALADQSLSLSGKVEAVQAAAGRLGSIDISGSIKRIVANIDSMGRYLHDLRVGLEDIYDDTSSAIAKQVDKAGDAASAINKAADSLNTAAKKLSDGVTEDMRIFNHHLDVIEDTLHDYLQTAGDKGQALLDTVNEQLKIINDQVGTIATGAQSSSGSLYDTTEAIINQLNNVESTITGMTAPPKKDIDDISDDPAEGEVKGRVVNCGNKGEVSADSNVGGIVGIASPEIELDPEEDLDLDGVDKLLVDTTIYIRATVRSCRNSGPVTAKNDCAGGILGRGDVGAVLDCVNVSGVTAESDKHCGGVAGLSRTIIRRCCALADLKGNDWVGGIAGKGNDIQDCRTMVQIDSEGECLGAIAGEAAGDVAGNYFVREDLAGVDGVDYEGRAMPLDYPDFVALEGLPGDFSHFTVTFVADGEQVAALPVEYGAGLAESQLPAVPEREGCYGQWEAFDSSRILRSLRIEAVYSPWISTLAAQGERPELLVEGAFGTDAALDVQPWEPGGTAVPQGYQAGKAYRFTVNGTEALSGKLTVRLRAPESKRQKEAAVLQNGRLEKVESTRDGSYLVFEMEGPGAVAVLEKERPLWPYVLAGSGGVLLLAAAALLVRRRRKPGAKPPAGPAGKDETAANEPAVVG